MKTIQELIRIVQDRISLPLDDDDRWSTTAVVDAFNHALDDKLAPDLISEGSNYLVQREVFTLSNYPLKAIPIPNRAAGRVIREVKYIASGTEIENEINCLAITLEDKDKYINDPLFYGSTVPYVFIENDSVRFIGGDGTGSIAIYYSLEPSILQNTTGQYATVTDCQLTVTLTVNTQTGSNTLTNPSIAPTSLNLLTGMPISGPNIPTGATITSVTSSTIVISSAANGTATNQSITIQKNQILATAGTSWDAFQAAGTTKFVDIYRKTTGAIVKANVRVARSSTLTTSYVISDLSSNEINQIKTYQYGGFPVSAPYESELVLLPAGKSEFSTIPYEYDQLLALYVCERILESLGDTEGLQVTMTKIKETKESISRLSQNRLVGEPNKLEDRRSLANVEPRSVQAIILDVYDRLPVSINQDPRWTTTAIIRTMNTVLVEKITPELISQENNFMVARQEYNMSEYPLKFIPIPKRAAGRIIREIKYVANATDSGTTNPYPDLEYNCLRISLEEKEKYINDPTFYNSPIPYVYIENDSVCFIGGLNNSGLTVGYLVIYYNIQPSTLTLTSGRYGYITTWSNGSSIFGGAEITARNDTIWTSYLSSSSSYYKYFDIYRKSTGTIIKANIKGFYISDTDTVGFEQGSIGINAKENTQIRKYQTGGFPTNTEQADLLLLPAGESEFLTIPQEYDHLLVLYTCERILQSLGDAQNLQILAEKIKETKDSITGLSQNRIQGEKTKLEDRRTMANAEPRSIQALILDVFDTVRVPFDKDVRWTTKAMIRAFNNVMVDKLAPDLVAEGSNYLVHRDVIPLTVNGSAVYPLNSIPLPRRAIGRTLREVKYLPSGKTKLDDELNCPAISLEEKDMYSSESDVYGSSVPYIYIENDNLRFIGGDLNGSLVLYYSLEPSKLTATYGRYATITDWRATTNINIIDSTIAGTDWSNYIASGSSKFVDIFCKSTGSILKSNVLVTRSTNSYTISGLTSDELKQIRTNQTGGFPTGSALVNYPAELLLVPAGECEFVTIPEEYDQLLVLYVAEKISESLGDAEGLTIIKTKINETRNSISRVTGNRLQGERRRLTDRRSIARIQRGQKWTRNYNKNYR